MNRIRKVVKKKKKHSAQGWELIGIDATIFHVSGTN